MALLLASPAAAQRVSHLGPGCWRTATSRQEAGSRMAATKPFSLRKGGSATGYFGKKKGLVILCEFKDLQFQLNNDREKYNEILNAHGYSSSEGFVGSVSDYFLEQSGGLFELQFDVVGPYTTRREMAYYGENDTEGLDKHPQEMVKEMCKKADKEVNFADYDWDGDGEVDEVFVVYAGMGESSGGGKTTIWPHMWSLSESLTLDGVRINVYACANELASETRIDGIGTFCHEFSHCLGLPDFYDLNYTGLYGMGSYDVMCMGCNNGLGFVPAGYTSFEKMACGWQQPIVLGDDDVIVENMKPMNEQGDFYILYNDAYPNEYYLVENRQRKGWDAKIPGKGLMICHVDYDEYVWCNNIPNTVMTKEEALKQGYACGNDHQRMTFFYANNSDLIPKLYPYGQCDSLTATSLPAATLFNNNSFGTKQMMGSILDIRQNTDGTMSFRYRSVNPTIVTGIGERQSLSPKPHNIYTLDGRVVGTSLKSLPHGIYIIDGQKVVR